MWGSVVSVPSTHQACTNTGLGREHESISYWVSSVLVVKGTVGGDGMGVRCHNRGRATAGRRWRAAVNSSAIGGACEAGSVYFRGGLVCCSVMPWRRCSEATSFGESVHDLCLQVFFVLFLSVSTGKTPNRQIKILVKMLKPHCLWNYIWLWTGLTCYLAQL